MWGQVEEHIKGMDKRRIIPTRVGTSRSGLYFERQLEDHPHACGDKADLPEYGNSQTGSSPRVWGQVIGGREYLEPPRIIPTRVGTRT